MASDEEEAALAMLTGFDLDMSRQVTQTSYRIRVLFTQIHPFVEHVVGRGWSMMRCLKSLPHGPLHQY